MPETAIAAAGARLGAACGKAGGIRGGERILHVAAEIAAVIDEPERGRVRDRGGPEEIAPAQFIGLVAQPARRDINQPIQRIGRFRPSGAARGMDGYGIDKYALRDDMY